MKDIPACHTDPAGACRLLPSKRAGRGLLGRLTSAVTHSRGRTGSLPRCYRAQNRLRFAGGLAACALPRRRGQGTAFCQLPLSPLNKKSNPPFTNFVPVFFSDARWPDCYHQNVEKPKISLDLGKARGPAATGATQLLLIEKHWALGPCWGAGVTLDKVPGPTSSTQITNSMISLVPCSSEEAKLSGGRRAHTCFPSCQDWRGQATL